MIVFENKDFVIVDKPTGWLSVPSRLGKEDERPCLGIWLSEKIGQRLWPVHRLDFEASGIILFAKHAKAHRDANSWFEERLVRKTYEAWTEISKEFQDIGIQEEWRSLLRRGKKRAYEASHGKEARTLAVCKGRQAWQGKDYLSWALQPLTGRPHQLRYELFRRGLPIVGDSLYGSRVSFDGIALRAISLGFSGCPQARQYNLPKEVAVMSLSSYLVSRSPESGL